MDMYTFIYEAFSKRLIAVIQMCTSDEADCKNPRKEKNTKAKEKLLPSELSKKCNIRKSRFM